MFKYILMFVLTAPLAGIYLMEQGEFGTSIGKDGHPNGATLAYAAYAAVLVLTTLLVIRAGGAHIVRALPRALERMSGRDGHYQACAIVLLMISTAVLFMMLFGFGGINVIAGAVGKSEFRTSLGPFGAVAYLMTKIIVPVGLAYCAFEYRHSRATALNTLLLLTNFAVALGIGLTWGFKSTGLFMLMPAMLILYWRVRFAQIVMIGAAASMVMVGLFYLFDSEVEGSTDALAFLWRRVTVLQGDVSWDIWDRHLAGEEFPPYARTLLPVFGDRIFSLLTGLDKEDYTNWIDYHYDLLLTYLSGVPLELVESGYSITGTPFSEGVIAAGFPGVLIFGALGGLLSGLTYRLVANSLRRGDAVMGALGAAYFCVNIFPWLYGGAVLQLIHISVVVGYLIMYLMLTAANRLVLVASNSVQSRSAPGVGGGVIDLRR